MQTVLRNHTGFSPHVFYTLKVTLAWLSTSVPSAGCCCTRCSVLRQPVVFSGFTCCVSMPRRCCLALGWLGEVVLRWVVFLSFFSSFFFSIIFNFFNYLFCSSSFFRSIVFRQLSLIRPKGRLCSYLPVECSLSLYLDMIQNPSHCHSVSLKGLFSAQSCLSCIPNPSLIWLPRTQ